MFIKTSTTNETTWAALKAAVDNGTIAQGDLVIFNLKNGEEVAVRATQDKKGKWFFVLEDCLADEHCMNKRPTNKGAWAACDMRQYLNNTVFALLPDELQALIAPTTISRSWTVSAWKLKTSCSCSPRRRCSARAAGRIVSRRTRSFCASSARRTA